MIRIGISSNKIQLFEIRRTKQTVAKLVHHLRFRVERFALAQLVGHIDRDIVVLASRSIGGRGVLMLAQFTVVVHRIGIVFVKRAT